MAKQVFVCEKCKTSYPTHTQAKTCEGSYCGNVGDVADTLHKWMCHQNHTGGCGYHYETQDFPGNARRPWLRKAKQVLAFARLMKIDARTLMLFLRNSEKL